MEAPKNTAKQQAASYYQLFEDYFDSVPSPTLEEFINLNSIKIVNLVQEGENVKQLWSSRYSAAANKRGVQNVTGKPDWSKVTSKVVARFAPPISSQISLRKRATEPSSSSNTPSTSSSSAPVTSSTESTNKRRKKIIDYLGENPAPVVSLCEDADQWEINGISVTKLLLKFRQKSIEKAKEGALETVQEELSLNCIFFIGSFGFGSNACLEYGFDESTWSDMVAECNDLFHVKDLPNETTHWVNEFATAARKKFQDCKAIIKRLPADFTHNNDCIENSMQNLLRMYLPSSTNKSKKGESSFTIDAVYPVFLPFFDETGLITRKGTDGQTPGSEQRRCKSSNKKQVGRFSDMLMVFEYGTLPEQALTIVEIKPPSKVVDGKHPDFIKLANELKDSLDKMIEDGFDDSEISVTGVLVEGFTCTVFVMDLAYQATYRLVPLSVFYLPRSHHDFSVLPAAYESMTTIPG